MLTFIGEYVGRPVMGLQEGGQVSRVLDAIIDPRKLRVVGFYCEHRASGVDKVLLIEDIRDIVNEGVVVDSEESLVDPSELVRLEDILDMNYQLVNNEIRTEGGDKQGTVTDYVVDDLSFRIERLYGKPKITRAMGNDYIIARNQIVSVSRGEVVVKDARDKPKQQARDRKTIFGFSI